jgi:hypothetical protein
LAAIANKMSTLNKKIIGTIKGKIGSVEIMTLIFFVVIFVISVRQFIKEGFKEDWIYIIFFILTLTTLLLSFINFKSKTIILTKDTLKVRRPLRIYSRTYLKEDLKGYDLEEYYDTQIGLARQIRIWTKDNKQIVFVRDAYSNYEGILTELKKFGLSYLGTIELKTKYKRLISIVLQIVSLLTVLMFAAAALVRNLK